MSIQPEVLPRLGRRRVVGAVLDTAPIRGVASGDRCSRTVRWPAADGLELCVKPRVSKAPFLHQWGRIEACGAPPASRLQFACGISIIRQANCGESDPSENEVPARPMRPRQPAVSKSKEQLN